MSLFFGSKNINEKGKPSPWSILLMRDMFFILSIDKLKVIKVNSVINWMKKYSEAYQHDQTEESLLSPLLMTFITLEDDSIHLTSDFAAHCIN